MAVEIEERELERKALSWPEKAKAITITNQESYDRAAELLLSIAALEKQVKEHHAPIKESAFRAHKAAVAAEKKLLDPLQEARGVLNRAISEWTREQERKRLEAERKAREEADRIAEELALQNAVEAEEMGMPDEMVEQILQETPYVPAPAVAPTYQTARGVSTRKTWKWRVTDLDRVPRQFMRLDEVRINGLVRAMGQATHIPGIEVYEDSIVTARTK